MNLFAANATRNSSGIFKTFHPKPVEEFLGLPYSLARLFDKLSVTQAKAAII